MRAKSSAPTSSSASASPNLTGELGLLHAVDDRLAAYGFETNTGVRFVVVVDVRAGEDGIRSGVGLKDSDVRPVRSLSPFSPLPRAGMMGGGDFVCFC